MSISTKTDLSTEATADRAMTETELMQGLTSGVTESPKSSEGVENAAAKRNGAGTSAILLVELTPHIWAPIG